METSDKHIEYQNLKDYKYNLPREKSLFYILFWRIVNILMFQLSFKFLNGYRVFLLRLFGAKIGKGVKIAPSAYIMYPWNIEIGSYCWIGDNVKIYSVDKFSMGDNVALAHDIFITTASHKLDSVNFETIRKPIIIQDEVWISSSVFIGMGVTIKKGSVIISQSGVYSDIPSGYICKGIPCKPYKKRIIIK